MSDEESNAGIVFPEKMTSLTKRIAKKYPNKRLLIHYTQPHDPYLGPTAMELFDETIGDTDEQLGHQFAQNPWRAWVKGDLETTPATLRKAYQENVDMALDAALDLCSHLSGKTVISADHGEHLYDRSKPIPTREIRHPDKIYTPKLVKVPWFEINGERRCIRESETVSLGQTGSERGDERAAEQLEALGYRK